MSKQAFIFRAGQKISIPSARLVGRIVSISNEQDLAVIRIDRRRRYLKDYFTRQETLIDGYLIIEWGRIQQMISYY